jgi:hypothetical protein
VLMEHLKETMAGMKEVISSLQKQVYSPDDISDSNAAESQLCGPFSPSQASISTRVLSGEQLTPCSSSSLVTKRRCSFSS